MAKKSDLDLSRLLSSIQDDRRTLQPFREKRVSAVARFAGTNWSDDAASKGQPVNLISLYVQVVARNLIPKNPRMMISTFQRENKPTVGTMESWVNQKIEDIDLAGTLRRARVDGLFSLGIIKVALGTPADATRFSWRMNAGEPFAEIVDLDDFVFETRARDFAQAAYIGHRYRCPLDVIKDDSRNYGKARKDLVATARTTTNQGGDDRIDILSGGSVSVDKDGFEDLIDLWEIYLPRHKLVYTFTDDQLSGCSANANDYGDLEPLRVQNWIGPDLGPYHILADMVVPGNAMPKAAVMDLIELHDASNQVMRKLMRQSERFKSILTTRGQDDDVQRMANTSDGEVCRTSTEPPKETSYGGPNQVLMAASMMFQEQFSKHAGNLETMGGLSTQAATLGQEKLLADNSSRAIADMQGNTITFVASVVKALCWYWWHDPFKVMRVKLPVGQGSGMEIVRKLTPQKRMATSWDDLQIKIDPYSLQHQTPSSRLQFIVQTVTQLAMPMMPLLQKQNIGFDASKLFSIISKLGDCPELEDIFTILEPTGDQVQSKTGAEEAPGMPAQTERTYTRRSVSEGTKQGNQRFLGNALLGINSGGANGNGKP